MEPSDLHSQQRNQDGAVSSEQQRQQDIRAFWRLREPLQHKIMVAVATVPGHLQTESTDLHTKHSDTNPKLSGGICGSDSSAANEQLPRSIWQPGVVKRLADYIKHLREVDQQPDERAVSGQPDQSSHVCTRNPHRTCNCPADACADDDATYRNARGPYLSAESTNYTCPISGRICLGVECREWCESGVDYSKT